MRTRIIAFVTALSLLAAPAVAADSRFERADDSRWMPIRQLLDRVESAGFRDVTEIERDDGVYEVKATGAAGQRMKLYLDPRTGEILGQKLRDDRRHRSDRDGRAADRHPSNPCTDGRCGHSIGSDGAAARAASR